MMMTPVRAARFLAVAAIVVAAGGPAGAVTGQDTGGVAAAIERAKSWQPGKLDGVGAGGGDLRQGRRGRCGWWTLETQADGAGGVQHALLCVPRAAPRDLDGA